MGKALVAYFSWSGATRGLAETIAKATGADLFEVNPVPRYTRDYNVVMSQGREEVRSGFRPVIDESGLDLDKYDTVFIGTPDWWGTMAPPIASLLENHDWAGKVIMPFCTHGGGGKGSAERDMRKMCPGADVRKTYVSRSRDREASTQKLQEWLEANQFGLN